MSGQDFFAIEWPQIKGVVCVKPETYLDQVLLLTGEIKFNAPLKLKRYGGHKWMDFVSNGGIINYVISQKVVNILIENKVTGWSVFDVDIEDTDLKYYGFCVTGKAVSLIKDICPGTHKGYKFQIDTWDRSDLFTFKNTGWKICTEKVKNLFIDQGVTNIIFTNIADIEYYNPVK